MKGSSLREEPRAKVLPTRILSLSAQHREAEEEEISGVETMPESRRHAGHRGGEHLVSDLRVGGWRWWVAVVGGAGGWRWWAVRVAGDGGVCVSLGWVPEGYDAAVCERGGVGVRRCGCATVWVYDGAGGG